MNSTSKNLVLFYSYLTTGKREISPPPPPPPLHFFMCSSLHGTIVLIITICGGICYGVIAFRKYSLQKESHSSSEWHCAKWGVQHPEQEFPEGDTDMITSSTSASTYGGRQLLRLVCNGRTKSESSARGECQQSTNVLLSRRLISNRLVQTRHYERRPRRKPYACDKLVPPLLA